MFFRDGGMEFDAKELLDNVFLYWHDHDVQEKKSSSPRQRSGRSMVRCRGEQSGLRSVEGVFACGGTTIVFLVKYLNCNHPTMKKNLQSRDGERVGSSSAVAAS